MLTSQRRIDAEPDDVTGLKDALLTPSM